MKKFLFKMVVYCLLLIAPFFAYFMYIQSLETRFSTSLMGTAVKKLEKAQSINEPKILITGGSSTIYSVLSEAISKEIGRPVVNMGCTAYVGLPFALNQIKASANDGDVVIIAPEFVMFSGVFSYNTVWYAVENNTKLYKTVPVSYYPHMFSAYYKYSKDKLGAENKRTENDKNDAEYYKKYTQFGDIIGERDNILEHKYNTQDLYKVNADLITGDMIDELNKFSRWAKKNNIDVYMSYAPFNRLAVIKQDGKTAQQGADELQQRIQNECDIPWLGTIAEGIMDENLFYDSNNHLNSEGAIIRTNKLIEDLKQVGY